MIVIKTLSRSSTSSSEEAGGHLKTSLNCLASLHFAEVYGDPAVHPQPESYNGNVNPTGPRACYDEGKRVAETLTCKFPLKEEILHIDSSQNNDADPLFRLHHRWISIPRRR